MSREETLRRRLEASENQYGRIRELLNRREDDIARLQERAEKRQQYINKLIDEADDWRKEARALEDALNQAETTIKALEREKVRLSRLRDIKNAEQNVLQIKLSELREQLASANTCIAQESQKNVSLKIQLEAANAQIAALQVATKKPSTTSASFFGPNHFGMFIVPEKKESSTQTANDERQLCAAPTS